MYGYLAVINTQGQIWARQLDPQGGNIGPGVEVAGPSLFPVPNGDQFVVNYLSGVGTTLGRNIPTICVVTNTGAVSVYLLRLLNGSLSFYAGWPLNGRAFGAPPDSLDAKYVLMFPDDTLCGMYVINHAGEIWWHGLIINPGFPQITRGRKLVGPSLFPVPGVPAPPDKYVVFAGRFVPNPTDDTPLLRGSILVVNTKGEVWAHDLSVSVEGPLSPCPDTVGVGYKLDGASLFGSPIFGTANDKYVVNYGNYLLVINTLGEVWAYAYDLSTVVAGLNIVYPGIKLNGPGLFGAPDDKYIITF